MEHTLRKKRVISVDTYQQMIEKGILTKNDKVELIHGDILEMSPIGSKHSAVADLLSTELILAIQREATVRVQNPIELKPNSQPQPDICIAKKNEDNYIDKLPTPNDILLLVEIADSSISFDKEVKMPMYAEAGISTFWIVDIQNETIEVYTQHEERSYKLKEILTKRDMLTLDEFQISIPISAIF